jgi:hypothetical protein
LTRVVAIARRGKHLCGEHAHPRKPTRHDREDIPCGGMLRSSLHARGVAHSRALSTRLAVGCPDTWDRASSAGPRAACWPAWSTTDAGTRRGPSLPFAAAGCHRDRHRG